MNMIVEKKINNLCAARDAIILRSMCDVYMFMDKTINASDMSLIKAFNKNLLDEVDKLFHMLEDIIQKFQFRRIIFSKRQYLTISDWTGLIKDIKYAKKYVFIDTQYYNISAKIKEYEKSILDGCYIR